MITQTTQQPATLPHRLIPLGKNKYAIVDVADFEALSRYRWKLVKSRACSYACRQTHIDGRNVTIRMHRLIANTPDDQECHHRNRNTLDNRRANLENLYPPEHVKKHKFAELA